MRRCPYDCQCNHANTKWGDPVNIIDRLLQNAADRTKPNDGRPRSERATPIANLLYDAADRITSLERRLVAMTTDRDQRRRENLGFSDINGKLHVRARALTERAEKAEAQLAIAVGSLVDAYCTPAANVSGPIPDGAIP